MGSKHLWKKRIRIRIFCQLSRFITDGAIMTGMITTDGMILITEAHITGVMIPSTTAGTHRSLSI